MKRRLPAVLPYAIVLLVFALMAGRLLWMIDQYAVNILFLDQWDFFSALFYDHSLTELFRWQHGPHRQGLGLPSTLLVAQFTDWNMRSEAFTVGLYVLIATGLALWLKRRLAGPLRYSDVAIPLLFLSLGQYGTFFNTPNPAHSALPLALIMGLGLVWTLRDRRTRFAATLVLDFILVYTGFGIFAGVVVLGLLLVEAVRDLGSERPFDSLLPFLCAGLAGLILGSFFIDYRFAPAIPDFQFPIDEWWNYPRFMAVALGEFLSIRGEPRELVGFLVLAGTTAVLSILGLSLFKGNQTRAIYWVIVLMLGFGLLYLMNLAIGRVSIGVDAAATSRYMTLIATIYFGLYLYFTTLESRWRKPATFTLIACLLWSSVFLQPRHFEVIHWFANIKTEWRDTYLATKSISHANQAAKFRLYPWPGRTNLQWKLDWLEERKLSFFAAGDEDP